MKFVKILTITSIVLLILLNSCSTKKDLSTPEKFAKEVLLSLINDDKGSIENMVLTEEVGPKNLPNRITKDLLSGKVMKDLVDEFDEIKNDGAYTKDLSSKVKIDWSTVTFVKADYTVKSLSSIKKLKYSGNVKFINKLHLFFKDNDNKYSVQLKDLLLIENQWYFAGSFNACKVL